MDNPKKYITTRPTIGNTETFVWYTPEQLLTIIEGVEKMYPSYEFHQVCTTPHGHDFIVMKLKEEK
jgi:hypothetical protein